MGISYLGAKRLLETNVVEMTFQRRNEKGGWPSSRRMLCTNSYTLLASLGGRMALNFKVPTQAPPYNPQDKNLVITWDIFMQDFRALPLESINVIAAFPVVEEKDIDEFWKYFDQAIRPMKSQEKISFMKK